MKYSILSINDSRKEHKDRIRDAMAGFEEVDTGSVNGNNPEELNAAIDRWGFDINFSIWKPGEGGVWYSNINAWGWAAENDDLMVFEDDAIPLERFSEAINNWTLPVDYDFISLYIPFEPVNAIMPVRFEKCYQQHGIVCMLYSIKGAKKILSLLKEEGLEWPVDIWLFKQHLAGKLKGYAPNPFSHRLINHDFDIATNIHNSDRIEVHQPTKDIDE
jgi:GR25 family glycosyltransferase involved in LPS biosynthesis